MPKVSVLLPVFNAVSSLGVAVGSILQQDFQDFELVLIDDGSEDATPELMFHFAESDSRIRLLRQSHRGIAAALNLGLAQTDTPIIARMDADDYSYPGRLSRQLAWLEEDPDTGLVSCLVEHRGDPEQQRGYAAHVAWLNSLQTPRQISLNRFIDAPFAHPSVMFRRRCVESFGAYDLSPGPEDFELWLRWLEAGVKMAKVPEVLFRWSDSPLRLSRQHADYSQEAFAGVRAKYLFRWLEGNNPYHPEIVIWGAGRKTRRRADPLLAMGCNVRFYLDFTAREGAVPTVDYRDTERYKQAFILSLVNNRGAREEIRNFLLGLKKTEGRDFLIS